MSLQFQEEISGTSFGDAAFPQPEFKQHKALGLLRATLDASTWARSSSRPSRIKRSCPKAAMPVSHDLTRREPEGKSRDGIELQPKAMDVLSLMIYGLTETPHTTPVFGSVFNTQDHPISECINQLQEQVDSARFQNYKARRLNRSMDSGTSTGSIYSCQTPFHEPSMASFAHRSTTTSTSWRSEPCMSFKDFPSMDWQCGAEDGL
jgi:hypothetical protein